MPMSIGQMDKAMSRKEVGELVFCLAGIVWFLLMMTVALWGIATKPWLRSPVENLIGSIFVVGGGFVGFILFVYILIVFSRDIISVHEESGCLMAKPRIGEPICLDSAHRYRARFVRTLPYLGRPSEKALLFLSPKIFVVRQSHKTWERMSARAELRDQT